MPAFPGGIVPSRLSHCQGHFQTLADLLHAARRQRTQDLQYLVLSDRRKRIAINHGVMEQARTASLLEC